MVHQHSGRHWQESENERGTGDFSSINLHKMEMMLEGKEENNGCSFLIQKCYDKFEALFF
jgi:hypothetical protein